MGFKRGNARTRGAILALVAAAVVGTLGPVPVPVRADEASSVEPTEYVTSFQAQFIVDPVAKTLSTVPLGVQIDTLGPTGETLNTASVPLALSAEPVPPPPGSGTPSCSIEGNTASNVHEYKPTFAYVPPPNDLGVYMYYQYQTYQLDEARFVGSQHTRQYVQCVAGGGSPRSGAQARNGGGTTMEDTTPRMLLPCNPSDGYGCAWGTGLDASDPPKTIATLDFELSGTINKAGVKAGVSIPVTTGGGGWTGAQGPLPRSALRDDPLPSQFEVNEVNGWWYTDNETTNYRGNVSQSLWEYPMSDTTPRTIRGSAWMRHHCGFFGCDTSTHYFPQPTPVPVDDGAGDAATCNEAASPVTGCYTISQPEIEAKWRDLGGSGGFLGEPTTHTASTACGGGKFNNFEGGAIYWRTDVGAHEVHGSIRDKWDTLGATCSVLGFPTSDELPTACGGGRKENFQGGGLTYRADLGAHAVTGPIYNKWTALGAECSYLGLPIYQDFDAYGPHPGGFIGEPYNGRIQRFEHNDVFWNKLSNETIAYGEGGGLTGSYYSNFDYSKVALRRPDRTINFDWGTGSPDPAVSVDKFNAQWRGRLVVPTDGYYTFSTVSDELVKLKVCPNPRGFGCPDEGNYVIDNWTAHTATEDNSTPVFLEAGTHNAVLFFRENSGAAVMKLSWSGPGIPKQIIPLNSASESVSVPLPEAPPLPVPADETAGDPTPPPPSSGGLG